MFSFKSSTKATPPQVLESLDLASVAKYMQSEQCKKVVLMLGAGVSTAAGIPDFRSPGTGLYANLARLNLPYPEAVFEINYFRMNPVPFYTLAHELYPGKFRPTLTHAFIRVLAEHSLLHTCFTQNIDTLERRAGVPADKIVEAHGSFATQRCLDCRWPYDGDKMREKVRVREIARCEQDGCGGLVKPDIVFFGESLPPAFSRAAAGLGRADLLLVIGTSLTVHPFASLVNYVPTECPRVLINLDRVGTIGSRTDDVVVLGNCDDVVRELCELLGWTEDVLKAWEETAGSVEVEKSVEASEEGASGAPAEVPVESPKKKVERLARALEKVFVFDRKETSEEGAAADGKEAEESKDDAEGSKPDAKAAEATVQPPVSEEQSKQAIEKDEEQSKKTGDATEATVQPPVSEEQPKQAIEKDEEKSKETGDATEATVQPPVSEEQPKEAIEKDEQSKKTGDAGPTEKL